MMNRTTKQTFARLAIAAAFVAGLSGVAVAQQGMATATESELNASWVDGTARPAQRTEFAGASQSGGAVFGNAFAAQPVSRFPDGIQTGSVPSEGGAGLSRGTNGSNPANASINWPL